MMRRRTMAAAVFLLAMVAAPRRSEAGLLDFIWEMSGPQMLGPSIGCMLTFKGNLEWCVVSPLRANELLGEENLHGPFLFLGGEYTFSTGRDGTDGAKYKFFNTHRAAVTPALMFRAGTWKNVTLYHAAGLTFERLFGVDDADFEAFNKAGFIFVPVEVAFPRFHVAVKFRLYPDGFTPDQFGQGAPYVGDRPHEWTVGFGVSFPLKKKDG